MIGLIVKKKTLKWIIGQIGNHRTVKLTFK